ncbi:MarR family winged helix-turn-helix transcriptional regulator [Azospirillum sp. sgz301742]
MSLRRTESYGYLVNYLGRLFARALERRIGPHGLFPGQMPALLALWEREGISQAELCRIVQVEQPTMANTLNRMERDELIRRVPDPEDRRRVLIYLTDRARALEEPVTALARDANGIAGQGFTEEESREAMRLLGKLISNLERDVSV